MIDLEVPFALSGAFFRQGGTTQVKDQVGLLRHFLVLRVWTQLHQHLSAKMYSIERKLVAVFSKRVASLRMSFILQKKRSTMLRLA